MSDEFGSEFFNKMQYGKESPSAHGTAVAATNMWVGQMPKVKSDRKPTYPKEHFGARSDAFRSVIHQYLYTNTWAVEHAAFQHLPLPFGLGVKGAVTPVEQTGGQGDYLWPFTPSMISANRPDSATLRFGDDVQAWLSEYCMCERIHISGQVAQGADASPVSLEWDFFGRQIQPSTFTSQVETATVVGTITDPGNAEVIITAAGMNNSPKTILVVVEDNDTASIVAGKIRTALAADADVIDLFIVSGTGADVVLTKRVTILVDATLNIAIDNDTCVGLTPDASSTDTSTAITSLPTLEPLNAKLSRFYLDNLWSDVGETELANLLRTFDIEILTGVHPAFEGSVSKTFNRHREGIIAVMGTIGIEGGSAANDLFSAHQDGDFNVGRFVLEGGAIGSGENHSLTLDWGGTFEDVTPISGADRGDNLATFVLHGFLDKTSGLALQANVVTDRNSY